MVMKTNSSKMMLSIVDMKDFGRIQKLETGVKFGRNSLFP
jgi:hypothetical protein